MAGYSQTEQSVFSPLKNRGHRRDSLRTRWHRSWPNRERGHLPTGSLLKADDLSGREPGWTGTAGLGRRRGWSDQAVLGWADHLPLTDLPLPVVFAGIISVTVVVLIPAPATGMIESENTVAGLGVFGCCLQGIGRGVGIFDRQVVILGTTVDWSLIRENGWRASVAPPGSCALIITIRRPMAFHRRGQTHKRPLSIRSSRPFHIPRVAGVGDGGDDSNNRNHDHQLNQGKAFVRFN